MLSRIRSILHREEGQVSNSFLGAVVLLIVVVLLVLFLTGRI